MRWLLSLLLLAGCGSSDGVVDAASDAPSDSSIPTDAQAPCAPSTFEVGDPSGSESPFAAGAGQARAGRIDAAALPVDRLGLGLWRAGDLAIANNRVGAIVSTTPRDIGDPHAGRLVAIGRVEGGALVEPADFGFIMLGIGRFAVGTESVTVLDDGSDGSSAIIRTQGRLTAIRALGDLLDTLIPGEFTDLPAAIDYELAPDAEHLDVYVSVRTGPRNLRASLGAMQLFFQSYRMLAWAPGVGFGERPTGGALSYLAFEDPRVTSYAWVGGQGPLMPFLGAGGADVFTSPRIAIDECDEGRVHVGRLVIAGPGLPPVQAAVARLEGGALTRVTGHVLEDDGSAASDVRVHVTTASGEHLTRAWPASDGAFDLEVDARASQLWAYRRGQPLVGPIAIAAGDNEIRMPAFATLEVEATDTAGAALPARIELFPETLADFAVPEAFGEESAGAGRVHVEYPADGQTTLRVAPGRWTLRVSRGPEYERFEPPTLDLAIGSARRIDATLERVVDTTGVICADYHIHSHRSVDSADDGALKVRGLVANGLEIPIRSEHEWVEDYQPLIESLGLSAFARGFAGLELTTFSYGHFGVFPLVPDRERPSGGAVLWYDRLAPDVFDEVRARPEAPALIINHPRAGGLRQGYFTETGFDPVTSTVTHPENWDEDFDVVEVWNDGDFERFRDSTVQDWLSLLSSGRRVFAVGSSDSHRIHTVPVGYPRTCLRLGTDDPRAVTGAMLRDATRAGRSYVSGGIYLDVTGPGGARPGDEASGAGDRASFEVVVQAPSWVEVNRLEVIVDGVTTETIPIGPGDADPTNPVERARMTIEANVLASGSYVIFHAAGDAAFDLGKRPFAVTNPIFLRR